MKDVPNTFQTVLDEIPTRCVIVMNEALGAGYMANAIALIAATVGQRHPVLVGAPFIDACGCSHPGVISIGIPMLCAPMLELQKLRQAALEKGYDVVDFPMEGQRTKDYEEVLDRVTYINTEDLQYAGIAIVGMKNGVSKLTRHLAMIR